MDVVVLHRRDYYSAALGLAHQNYSGTKSRHSQPYSVTEKRILKFSSIDLWYGDILCAGQTAKQYWALLDKEEQLRAEKIKIARLRNQFIAIRAKVRLKLAEYTGELPERISFSKSEFGKPGLVNTDQIFFNISHSGNKLLIAVGPIIQLGVDIEVLKDRRSYEGLAGKCFSPEELIRWNALSDEEKIPAFYLAWTKKEAFVKAVGRGIALGLDQCVIAPHQGGQFFSVPDAHQPASDWQIIELELGKGIAGAMVVKCKQITFELKNLVGC